MPHLDPYQHSLPFLLLTLWQIPSNVRVRGTVERWESFKSFCWIWYMYHPGLKRRPEWPIVSDVFVTFSPRFPNAEACWSKPSSFKFFKFSRVTSTALVARLLVNGYDNRFFFYNKPKSREKNWRYEVGLSSTFSLYISWNLSWSGFNNCLTTSTYVTGQPSFFLLSTHCSNPRPVINSKRSRAQSRQCLVN